VFKISFAGYEQACDVAFVDELFVFKMLDGGLLIFLVVLEFGQVESGMNFIRWYDDSQRWHSIAAQNWYILFLHNIMP
jgi:hypothetical protein